jgi:hypothetical protein
MLTEYTRIFSNGLWNSLRMRPVYVSHTEPFYQESPRLLEWVKHTAARGSSCRLTGIHSLLHFLLHQQLKSLILVYHLNSILERVPLNYIHTWYIFITVLPDKVYISSDQSSENIFLVHDQVIKDWIVLCVYCIPDCFVFCSWWLNIENLVKRRYLIYWSIGVPHYPVFEGIDPRTLWVGLVFIILIFYITPLLVFV